MRIARLVSVYINPATTLRKITPHKFSPLRIGGILSIQRVYLYNIQTQLSQKHSILKMFKNVHLIIKLT